jgi:hypothetical protein
MVYRIHERNYSSAVNINIQEINYLNSPCRTACQYAISCDMFSLFTEKFKKWNYDNSSLEYWYFPLICSRITISLLIKTDMNIHSHMNAKVIKYVIIWIEIIFIELFAISYRSV